MKLALDHDYSRRIAEQLRDGGHDVVAAVENGWHQEDDEPLLALCVADRRALLTNNVGDFTAIARRWVVDGRQHCGLIFTSDASLPRGRDTIGKFVGLLDELLELHSELDAFTNRVHWL